MIWDRYLISNKPSLCLLPSPVGTGEHQAVNEHHQQDDPFQLSGTLKVWQRVSAHWEAQVFPKTESAFSATPSDLKIAVTAGRQLLWVPGPEQLSPQGFILKAAVSILASW